MSSDQVHSNIHYTATVCTSFTWLMVQSDHKQHQMLLLLRGVCHQQKASYTRYTGALEGKQPNKNNQRMFTFATECIMVDITQAISNLPQQVCVLVKQQEQQ